MDPIAIHLRADGIAVVHAPTDLDKDSAPVLRRAFIALANSAIKPVVIVACGAVDFSDSTGLGALVGGQRRMTAKGGHLVLAAVNERFAKVLRITMMNRQFEIYPTAPDAVEAFAGTASGAESSDV